MDEHGVYVPLIQGKSMASMLRNQQTLGLFHSIPSHGESVKIRYQKEPFRDDTPQTFYGPS